MGKCFHCGAEEKLHRDTSKQCPKNGWADTIYLSTYEGLLREVLNALKVLVWDRIIKAYLKENDPKALEQAEEAIKKVEEEGLLK